MANNNQRNDPERNDDIVIRIPQIFVLVLVIAALVSVLVMAPLVPDWLNEMRDDVDVSETPTEQVDGVVEDEDPPPTSTNTDTPNTEPSEEAVEAETVAVSDDGSTNRNVSITQEVTDTIEPDTCSVRVTGAANIRSGPGTNFERVSSAAEGEILEVTGQANGWWRIANHGDWWISGTLVEILVDADCSDVPVIRIESSPTATTPPPSIIPTITGLPTAVPTTPVPPVPPPVATTPVPVVPTTVVPTVDNSLRTMNLTQGCQAELGSNFTAVDNGGWFCVNQNNPNDREPFTLDEACRIIFGGQYHAVSQNGQDLTCSSN